MLRESKIGLDLDVMLEKVKPEHVGISMFEMVEAGTKDVVRDADFGVRPVYK